MRAARDHLDYAMLGSLVGTGIAKLVDVWGVIKTLASVQMVRLAVTPSAAIGVFSASTQPTKRPA